MSHRIVHVVWEDSAAAANADGVWQLRDAAPLAPKHIETAGILIQETEAHVTVAQSLTEDKQAGSFVIPRGCIQAMRTLEFTGVTLHAQATPTALTVDEARECRDLIDRMGMAKRNRWSPADRRTYDTIIPKLTAICDGCTGSGSSERG